MKKQAAKILSFHFKVHKDSGLNRRSVCGSILDTRHVSHRTYSNGHCSTADHEDDEWQWQGIPSRRQHRQGLVFASSYQSFLTFNIQDSVDAPRPNGRILIHFNYQFWQQYSHWDGLQWNNEPHLWGYVLFLHPGFNTTSSPVFRFWKVGGGGRGGRKRKTNKQKWVCWCALSFDFWLTPPSQVNNAAAHLVSSSIIGAHFGEDPLPPPRRLPVIRGQSDASAYIIKRFVCRYVPVVAHPRVLYSERRGLISTTK